MAKKDYEARTEALLEPIVAEYGVRVYDVEYVKEGSDWYLRAYIDKDEGVTIDDCENVSRALNVKLDEEDYIEDAYILEVSSPGLGRKLTKERHFRQSMGLEIELKTYKPVDKKKEFVGILSDYDNGAVTILEDGKPRTFSKDEIANVRLTFDF
ncbi:MAG: ribosome maturation factor RimP [Lachnospiraceae bacterium]|nr:ribosome maturation factor RimP [Candidatus Colinaster scatohippi]